MRSRITPLWILIALIACSSPGKTFTVEERDGVQYVHNLAPPWGEEPGIAIEHVKTVGRAEAEDDRYLLYRAAIGKRLPEPKAFGVILRPGDACLRLYSFFAMASAIHLTFSGS